MGAVYESHKQLKGWVSSYLNRKGLTGPNGLPLYSYSTTDNELQFLSAALAVNAEERHGLISRIYWAAGYCLFVSEKYRREYEASWSWQAFDAELGIKLQPSEHTELVKLGLGFWDRPIRYRSNGADYLGSLFAEGGLPWKLLQNERHGFGRAIKAGLKYYHEYKRDGGDIVQVIREYGQYFPQSFKNDEKYQLLASIAETLMVLAEQHGLDQQEDPASFLNRHLPQWRDEFPLPLEEDNGFALVNEWLRDAGSRLEERKRTEEMARQFTCEHQLDGPMKSACLQAKVWLSRSLQIKLGARKIITSRVELALYEGDRLALKLGVAYGRLEGDVLTIKMPSEVAKLRRQSPEKPLFVVSSCAGERLDTHAIQSSEVDWNQLPTVFVEEDDVTRLVGIASVKCKASEVLLRIPACINSQGGELLINDVEGGAWHRINEQLTISTSGSRYVIEPGNSSGVERVELQGVISSYDTLPVTTWLGWPRCLLINSLDEGYQPDGFYS
ncbi:MULTISPECIES: STY4851/ECs_5259 family protein [unclassified Halomonas]|uniref:STY4851/ECs_5259 family protein n=1 Tax=unclassified Halomonas TaxID=2609666 RepID=UPI003CE82A4F